MAPRKASATEATTPATPAAPAQVTVSGYSVVLTAFIPVASDDLKKQALIPTIMAGIQEGTHTFADLAPHLKQEEFKTAYIRKRMPKDEAAEIMGLAKPEAGNAGQSEQKDEGEESSDDHGKTDGDAEDYDPDTGELMEGGDDPHYE